MMDQALTNADTALLKDHDEYLSRDEYDINILNYQKIAETRMANMYRFLVQRMEIASQVMQLSIKQWSSFMTDSQKWMGNCSIEDGRIHNFHSLSTLGLTILTKSVFKAQQSRSY